MARSTLLFAALVVTSWLQLAVLADDLPFLTVRKVDRTINPNSPRSYVIADQWGREVMLRGACVETEERNLPGNHTQRPETPEPYANGQCPPNYQSYDEPPVCGVDFGKGKFAVNASDEGLNDFAQARALGFNLMRICLSWSQLEPTPGFYDPQYLTRIEQLADWAEEQGIYLILDMHEDLYSQFIVYNGTGAFPPLLTPSSGQDGAAAWAVDSGGWPSVALFGVGNLNLAMMAAFDSFYENKVLPGVPQGAAPGPGLQDHFIGAVTALAARFANRSVIAGYELLNEPQPGTYLEPARFSRDYLYPLYARIVQAVTGVRDGLPTCNSTADAYKQVQARRGNSSSSTTTSSGAGAAGPLLPAVTCAYPDAGIHSTQLIFAEPNSVRNLLDFSPGSPTGPWTSYANLVHTPHVYTHVFTIDQQFPQLNISALYPPSWAFAYDTATAEANTMASALFVTEFGAGALQDDELVIPTLNEAERHLTGGTLWSWKSNCGADGSGDYCQEDMWSMYRAAIGAGGPIAPNGAIFPQRERMMSRVHTRGALGEVLAAGYNTTDRSYALAANVSAAQWRSLVTHAAAEARMAVAHSYCRPMPAAAAAAAAPVRVALHDFTGWCGGVGQQWQPLELHVEPSLYHGRMPRTLAANGTVTEIYLPRSVANNATAGNNAALLGTVAWPDGSRSAYFRPTAAGVYVVVVGAEPGAAARDAASVAEAVLRNAPTLAEAEASQRAAVAPGSPGDSTLRAYVDLVRAGAAAAGFPLSG